MTRRSGLIAAAAALLSGCSGATVLDRLVARDSYRSEPDQAYGPDPRQRLDVYRPLAGPPSPSRGAGSAGLPVVVFFYGGSWTRGERADYRFVGESLASAGVIAVVADYRLSPQVRYPAFLEDCAQAVRWTRAQLPALGGDPARVFLMGHSAGAYNAAMLALDPRWLRAGDVAGGVPPPLAGWIGLAGPYDFLPIRDQETQVAFDWPATPADSQPLAHAGAAAPRTLLLAARRDSVVDPERNTLGLAGRLRAAGVDVQAELLDGVSHVSLAAALARPLAWLAPVRAPVLRFLGAG